MAAPNVIRRMFPKEADRVRYNELIALKQITANLSLSICYTPLDGPQFHKYFIAPPEHRDLLIEHFLNVCRTGYLNDEPVSSACITDGGQWNGKIALFANAVTPLWTPNVGFGKTDAEYLGSLYTPPPEPIPTEIEAEPITRAAFAEEAPVQEKEEVVNAA